ncbi:hypothetical protein B0H14DRAFT_947431 [Mycena olivaceomarginata]|nr:hypothetical protein B0H14DRAFT_947431 [Mycena olivaceomarginata]
MVHNNHVLHRRIQIRQDGLFDTPTVAGLTTASVAQTGAPAANSLALNTAAGTDAPGHDSFNFSVSPTATFTSTPTSDPSSDSDADASVSPSAVAGSSSEIALGTVIGACVGALAACALIILIGLWLYRRGTKPRPRSPSSAHKVQDKERAWGKLEEDNDDKWEGKDGNKHTQKGVVSVGPMETLTMFKKGTPSMRTTYTHTPEPELAHLPPIAPFDHPFAQYHPDLAEKLAMEDSSDLPQPRPFLARVDAMAPISWDGDTVGRDSFLSLNSNPAATYDLALPTPKLTSSEPHHWESADVMQFGHTEDDADEPPRGRASSIVDPDAAPRRKSNNNPFFGARMSTHSTRSRSGSRASSRAPSPTLPDPITMPAPPALAYTREEKGKARAVTPPSPRGSTASGVSTITGVNPFSDPPAFTPPSMSFSSSAPAHESTGSHDRALQSLIAALGLPAEDVEARLRVASMQPSIVSEISAYSEMDAETLHQSWPVPPSRPQPGDA